VTDLFVLEASGNCHIDNCRLTGEAGETAVAAGTAAMYAAVLTVETAEGLTAAASAEAVYDGAMETKDLLID